MGGVTGTDAPEESCDAGSLAISHRFTRAFEYAASMDFENRGVSYPVAMTLTMTSAFYYCILFVAWWLCSSPSHRERGLLGACTIASVCSVVHWSAHGEDHVFRMVDLFAAKGVVLYLVWYSASSGYCLLLAWPIICVMLFCAACVLYTGDKRNDMGYGYAHFMFHTATLSWILVAITCPDSPKPSLSCQR